MQSSGVNWKWVKVETERREIERRNSVSCSTVIRPPFFLECNSGDSPDRGYRYNTISCFILSECADDITDSYDVISTSAWRIPSVTHQSEGVSSLSSSLLSGRDATRVHKAGFSQSCCIKGFIIIIVMIVRALTTNR